MTVDESSPLLPRDGDHGLGEISRDDDEIESSVAGPPIEQEPKLLDIPVGEKLAYNDYTTIDWLQDLVQDSSRLRNIHSKKGWRCRLASWFDQASGWIAAAVIGVLTACVAFLVDIAEATVSDWKTGYCRTNILATREACCRSIVPGPGILFSTSREAAPDCDLFQPWSSSFIASYAIYLAFALVFGVLSASVTLLTKTSLPATAPTTDNKSASCPAPPDPSLTGKTMYMAAGSGIPEIKTILSGFVIPSFLSLRVLVVKAIGAVFAVATGMCLGKEGPFVHISTCVGWLVATQFPKYRDNGRKMREMLSAACAAGLSVAFGAPIGGVLFSYEEISTYFPRKVLWRAFLCSLSAAVTLKALNPNGTGKLVLFETNYGTSYNAVHYLVFVMLGIAGGIFGGLFCRLNFLWSKWFRGFKIIKNHPVLEVFLVVLVTVLLQYPNPITREPGDAIIKNLLVDCRSDASSTLWICEQESSSPIPSSYYAYLIHGTLTKLVLTIITFGIKVPSGVIIPALDAGAFFGRLVGQLPLLYSSQISPGIFAMVGSAAFLAGVSRMTISLCVIMFELTGELEYVVPHMIAILVAKWTADAIGKDSVYDLAQSILGHPFLDLDHVMGKVQREDATVEELIPPRRTMEEITVVVPREGTVPRSDLTRKLNQLRARGLMDAGLVLVNETHHLLGYITQNELSFALSQMPVSDDGISDAIRVLGTAETAPDHGHVLTSIVDRTPLTISAGAPLEYAVEMFAKLGLRHLMVLDEEGSGRLVGVIIKKRLVAYLDRLKHA